MQVRGHCQPGFEAVAEAFATEMARRQKELEKFSAASGKQRGNGPIPPSPRGGGALSLFVLGERVVSVVCGSSGGVGVGGNDQWEEDTLVNVYSCSKGVTAMLCTVLADDKAVSRFKFSAPVSALWPEFACQGKERITVADLLSHSAGLAYFDDDETLPQASLPSPTVPGGEGDNNGAPGDDAAKRDALESFLARQTPKWKIEAGRHGYHKISHGLYADALIHRATGMNTRQFYHEELGTTAEFYFGIPEVPDVTERVARLLLVPGALEEASEVEIKATTVLQGFSPWRYRHQLLPSAVGFTSAESLAQLYSSFARGEMVRTTSRDDALHPNTHGESVYSKGTHRTYTRAGFQRVPAAFAGSDAPIHSSYPSGYFHHGWGGSLGYGDSEEDFGLGFVTNILLAESEEEEWGARLRLLDSVYHCVRQFRASPHAKL
jgi:CubicO group peptidase (beta-lactamase class C family)